MNIKWLKIFCVSLSLLFSSVALHAEEIIVQDPETGQSTYSYIDNSDVTTKVSKTKSKVSATALSCTGTITSTISPTQILGGYSKTYSFSQSSACNNQYASISITNLSTAYLAVGLQKYSSGSWQWVVNPLGYSISMQLTTGSYRWVVKNNSGITGTYSGKYSSRF